VAGEDEADLCARDRRLPTRSVPHIGITHIAPALGCRSADLHRGIELCPVGPRDFTGWHQHYADIPLGAVGDGWMDTGTVTGTETVTAEATKVFGGVSGPGSDHSLTRPFVARNVPFEVRLRLRLEL
jgi:hypothetical protein